MPATSRTECPCCPTGLAFGSGPGRRANWALELGMDQRHKIILDVPGQMKLYSPAPCRPARAIPVGQLQPVWLPRPDRKTAPVNGIPVQTLAARLHRLYRFVRTSDDVSMKEFLATRPGASITDRRERAIWERRRLPTD